MHSKKERKWKISNKATDNLNKCTDPQNVVSLDEHLKATYSRIPKLKRKVICLHDRII